MLFIKPLVQICLCDFPRSAVKYTFPGILKRMENVIFKKLVAGTDEQVVSSSHVSFSPSLFIFDIDLSKMFYFKVYMFVIYKFYLEYINVNSTILKDLKGSAHALIEPSFISVLSKLFRLIFL